MMTKKNFIGFEKIIFVLLLSTQLNICLEAFPFLKSSLNRPSSETYFDSNENLANWARTKDVQHNSLRDFCEYYFNSEEWFNLRQQVRDDCIILLSNYQTALKFDRERRFFALHVGKANNQMNSETSNKGFKYGK
jgi:hypothetical protein